MNNKSNHIKFSLFAISLFLSLVAVDAHTASTPVSGLKLIILGDSLVDVGNDPAITSLLQTPPNGDLVPGFVVPPPTRYDRGRFSNGPVMSDFIAARGGFFLKATETGFDLKTDSVSYAYGGAQTGKVNLTPGGFPVPGLIGQVAKLRKDLISSKTNITKTTLIIWVGANDYLNAPNPDYPSTVNNIVDAAEDLAALGAYRIIIVNLPDLGKVPICKIFNNCQLLTQFTNNHNQYLAQQLEDLKKTQLSTKIELFDARSIFDILFANPAKFGFLNDLSPGSARGCLFQEPTTFNLNNCGIVNFTSKNIFWDEVHPSTRVHEILANELWRRFFQ